MNRKTLDRACGYVYGTVRNIFNESLDKVYIILAENLNGIVDGFDNEALKAGVNNEEVDALMGKAGLENGKDYFIADGTITVLSDSLGRFRIPVQMFDDVKKLQVVFFKDDHIRSISRIELKRKQKLELQPQLVPVFGSVSGYVYDKDTGRAVANTLVGFRSASNYQIVKTDSSGYYNLPKLINGKYSIEVINNPDFKELIEDGFTISGQRIKKNFPVILNFRGSKILYLVVFCEQQNSYRKN